LGRRFICPECQTKIHAPKPAVLFTCPACRADLAAPEKLILQDFECPHCEQSVLIPDLSTVSCPSCEVAVELDREYYAELVGSDFECPECQAKIPVAPLPGSSVEAQESDDAILPKGFGRKTMKIDNLIMQMPQAQRLSVGVCPYCAGKVHVLHGSSYVCKTCGRIMRTANKPPSQGVS